MAFKILSVVGARPNFMKVAAICEAIKEYNPQGQSPRSITYWCIPANIMTPTCRTHFLTIWSCQSQICSWESAQVLTRRRLRKSWKASRTFLREKPHDRDRGGRCEFDSCLRAGDQKNLLSGRHMEEISFLDSLMWRRACEALTEPCRRRLIGS